MENLDSYKLTSGLFVCSQSFPTLTQITWRLFAKFIILIILFPCEVLLWLPLVYGVKSKVLTLVFKVLHSPLRTCLTMFIKDFTSSKITFPFCFPQLVHNSSSSQLSFTHQAIIGPILNAKDGARSCWWYSLFPIKKPCLLTHSASVTRDGFPSFLWPPSLEILRWGVSDPMKNIFQYVPSSKVFLLFDLVIPLLGI